MHRDNFTFILELQNYPRLCSYLQSDILLDDFGTNAVRIPSPNQTTCLFVILSHLLFYILSRVYPYFFCFFRRTLR